MLKDERPYSPSLWPTRLVITVAFLDLFMQFPVIAPYARSLGTPPGLVGIIVALYSVTNLIGNLIAGVVLDRWGRKLPILFGLLATAIALLGYAIARTPQQLMVARALHGLTTAVLTPGAFALLGDSTHVKRRAGVMGVSGSFIAIAAVIGPMTAGVVRDRIGANAVFLVSATLMLATVPLFWRFVTEPAQTTEPQAQERSWAIAVSLWRYPRLSTSYLAALALTIGLGTLVAHLPIVMVERGEPATRMGLVFTVFAIASIIAMASPLNRLSDRHEGLWTMMAGLALVSAGMAVLGTLPNLRGSLLGMAIFGLGFGLLFPAMTALVAEAVRQEQRGQAFGVFYAIFSLGVIIGSVSSGLLSQRLGASNVVPFLLSMSAALATMPILIAIWGRQRKKSAR